MSPKLSIITVHKDSLNELEKTIRSIYPKLCDDVEHIVVARIPEAEIEPSKNMCHQSSLIVNKDRSLYDAMNIGLKNAKGQFVSFINSGDELSGEIQLHELNQSVCLAYTPTLHLDNIIYEAAGSTLNHQNFIAPNDDTAVFNEVYGIFADASWMETLIDKYGIRHIARPYVTFHYGGLSTKPSLKQSVRNLRFDKYTLPRLKLLIKAIFVSFGLESLNKTLLLKGYK